MAEKVKKKLTTKQITAIIMLAVLLVAVIAVAVALIVVSEFNTARKEADGLSILWSADKPPSWNIREKT